MDASVGDQDVQPCSPQQRHKYIAKLAYDGSCYAGFQLQAGNRSRTRTIQGVVEKALTKFVALPREELLVQGAGRTDAGVHARGQCIQFFSERELDAERTVRALNSLLPADVSVLAACAVPLGFNVRFSLGKVYHYDIHMEPVQDPFTCRFRYHLQQAHRFSVPAMAHAAQAFCGTHKFSAFSSLPRDGSQRPPVRTIRRFEVVPIQGGIRFEVEGTGFLYKQVRHMVGALMAVGEGRLSDGDIEAALRGGSDAAVLNRQGPKQYTVAEARGLCLARVFLPPPGDAL